MKNINLYLFFIFPFYCAYLYAQTENSAEKNLNPDWSYCFEFTWFGPQYDNVTTFNGTCEDYLDDTRAKNIPCNPPIVISYDGTPPDIDDLWDNHKASVLCRRTDSQVCVKYSFIYNGEVQNATYMCTKVQVIGESSPITGCYSQKQEGYDIEMCVCKSNPGLYRQNVCNSGTSSTLYASLLFVLPFLYLYVK